VLRFFVFCFFGFSDKSEQSDGLVRYDAAEVRRAAAAVRALRISAATAVAASEHSSTTWHRSPHLRQSAVRGSIKRAHLLTLLQRHRVRLHKLRHAAQCGHGGHGQQACSRRLLGPRRVQQHGAPHDRLTHSSDTRTSDSTKQLVRIRTAPQLETRSSISIPASASARLAATTDAENTPEAEPISSETMRNH
jgi:hypothetical protein